MRRLRVWLCVCGLMFLFFIVLQAPASLIAMGMQQQYPELKISGVSGTVWHGRAYGVAGRLRGQNMALNTLSWQLRPLSFLMLRPTVELQANLGPQNFSARLSWLLGNRLRLQDLQAHVPADIFSARSAIPMTGQISAEIETLTVDGQAITDLKGRIVLQDAVMIGEGRGLPLGSFAAELAESGDGGMVATLFDLGGALDLKSEIKLDLQGNYQMDAIVAVRDGAHELLHEQLQDWLPLLGESIGEERYRLSPRGNLW